MSVVPYQRPDQNRAWTSLLPMAAELAGQIAGTDFVPVAMRNNPAMVAAAILYGDEVGLGPMISLSRIAVINGRPTLAAETQRALILAAGHDLWIEETTVTRCTICGRRKGSEATSRITWTIDDARRANLAGKQPWRLYPRQMLLARASAELARAVFPDAIGGLAASEELEDDPEQAATANGPEPAKPTSRRRRANVTTTETSTVEPSVASTTEAPPRPDPAPPAAGAASPFVPPPSVRARALPEDEQALIEQVEADFDAHPIETIAGPPPLEPPPITEAQRRKIHALFHEREVEDRDERLRLCGQMIGREVSTSTGLTIDEASQIIEFLQQD